MLAHGDASATDFAALGGTPTAATLDDLAVELEALSGKTFAILVTDGGANCDASLTCDASACTDDNGGSPGCAALDSMTICARSCVRALRIPGSASAG